MAINYTISYTFSSGTTISSSQMNMNLSDNANTWTGLEALTKSFSNLRVDTTPTTSTDVAIKSYVDKLNGNRRPVLQYSSGTVVNLETGLNGTSGQALIVFQDGTSRTDSTTGRINLTVSQTAAFSGSAQSGIDTGSVANNNFYAVYAVKVTDSSANFVTTASLLFPTLANFTTLNTRFGTNGWVYLGYICYGDNSGTANAVVKFYQAGNTTIFANTGTTGNAAGGVGPRLATTAGATSVTYSYAAGTGHPNLPNTITHCLYEYGATSLAASLQFQDSGGNHNIFSYQAASGPTNVGRFWMSAAEGAKLALGASTAADIFLSGFIDGALGIGANPLL